MRSWRRLTALLLFALALTPCAAWADTATFARTIYLFWDNDRTHGVTSDYKMKAYRVTLDKFQVKNPQDGDRILRSKEPGVIALGVAAEMLAVRERAKREAQRSPLSARR